MLAPGPPVGGHHAVISPLVTQNTRQQIMTFRSALPVDGIIGAHDRPGVCFLHDHLKASEVDLPQGSQRDTRIAVLPVRFLVVAGKMLDAGRYAHRLNAPDLRTGDLARQIRIL